MQQYTRIVVLTLEILEGLGLGAAGAAGAGAAGAVGSGAAGGAQGSGLSAASFYSNVPPPAAAMEQGGEAEQQGEQGEEGVQPTGYTTAFTEGGLGRGERERGVCLCCVVVVFAHAPQITSAWPSLSAPPHRNAYRFAPSPRRPAAVRPAPKQQRSGRGSAGPAGHKPSTGRGGGGGNRTRAGGAAAGVLCGRGAGLQPVQRGVHPVRGAGVCCRVDRGLKAGLGCGLKPQGL